MAALSVFRRILSFPVTAFSRYILTVRLALVLYVL